jgi:hypothetical protein
VSHDNPAEFEALMLRLAARRVLETCQRAGAPEPPRAKAILGTYTPDRQAADANSFFDWCKRKGLEFLVVDGATGEWAATLSPPHYLPPNDDRLSEILRRSLYVIEGGKNQMQRT